MQLPVGPQLGAPSALSAAKAALDEGDYDLASELQQMIQSKVNTLLDLYGEYTKNIL